MAMKGLLLFCFLVLIESFARSDGAIIIHDNCTSPQPKLGRSSFPAGFIFGTAASAYQTEGAAAEGGRFPSIWDTFSEGSPERIADGSNGSTADDFYHRFKGDIGLMKEMGMDSFRFSISWSRILPRGNIRGGVNEAGLEFYNKTINTLLSEGLEPFVTLFHWDVPQALENEYGGFLSPHIVKDFRDFVDVCYKYYGDRVKYWITLNEPWTFSTSGYNYGTSAPGRCSKWLNKACEVGNSATEPYNVAHHLLLSHAAAVQLYREKYQESQNGKIGITLVSYWIEPYNPNSKADREAAEIGLDFMYGWFMNPLTNGDYPDIMRKLVGKRLPQFTNSTSMIVNGSFDFIGVNYYTARYATQYLANNSVHVSYSTDSHIDLMWEKDGKPIGEPTGSSWLFVYPEGIRRLLVYTKEKYNNPVIYITESGVSEVNNSTLPLKKALDDGQRIYCYSSHLCKVKRAIDQDGVNVKGYFAWAFSDNYEWEAGYTVRFGLYFIDYNDNLRRYPKRSVGWFKNFLKK